MSSWPANIEVLGTWPMAMNTPSVKVLMDHYTAATTTGKATPTNALRSVFSAACQSPPSLSLWGPPPV